MVYGQVFLFNPVLKKNYLYQCMKADEGFNSIYDHFCPFTYIYINFP